MHNSLLPLRLGISFVSIYTALLPGVVWGIILKDQSRHPLAQIQYHLGEVTICPSEPRSSVITTIPVVDALVDQPQTSGIIDDHV